MKSHTRFNNGEADILALKLCVWCPDSANEFSPADLAPDQIVRVIHHLHLIGLSIPYPELDRMSGAATGFCCHVLGEFENAPLGVLCKGCRSRLTCAVLNAPCYIVSDAHLGVASPQIERSFVGFLRGLAGEANSLV